MKINNTRNAVKRMLSDHMALRDDDNALIANVWAMELQRQGIEIKEMRAFEFLASLATGRLPSSESITRMRRRLQTEYPSLRGNTWDKRHKEQVTVQKDLGYGVV